MLSHCSNITKLLILFHCLAGYKCSLSAPLPRPLNISNLSVLVVGFQKMGYALLAGGGGAALGYRSVATKKEVEWPE